MLTYYKVHLKKPFTPIAPYTRITECGEVIGSSAVKYWEFSHTNRISGEKWCKNCLRVSGAK